MWTCIRNCRSFDPFLRFSRKQPLIWLHRPKRAFAIFALVYCHQTFRFCQGPSSITATAFSLTERRCYHALGGRIQSTRERRHVLDQILPTTERSSVKLFSTTPSSSFSSTVYETIQHLPRLFVENGNGLSTTTAMPALRPNAMIPLTSNQAHYLLDVMRITNTKRWGRDHAGHVRIFNGRDGEWLAKVVELDNAGSDSGNKKQRRRHKSSNKNSAGNDVGIATDVVLECVELVVPQPPAESSTSSTVELYLGRLKKKQQRKWVLEKVTELGIDGITLLDTEYSMGSGGSNNNNDDRGDPWDYDKHKAHVTEAAEQCERLTLPMLPSELLLWDNLVEQMRGTASSNMEGTMHYWLVCRERSKSSPPILSVLQSIEAKHNDHFRSSDNIEGRPKLAFRILVGPEGGWSPTELETFESMIEKQGDLGGQLPQQQVQFVSLGSTVLRAETAAVAAVATVAMHQDAVQGVSDDSGSEKQ